jgi:serine/threonine protein kinase
VSIPHVMAQTILDAGPEETDLIGRTISHYRVRSAIGTGAMGQVFRAVDTKLDRDVALKVLPAAMAEVPASLIRFSERRARLLR